jgi:hypothetical protein
LFVLAPSLGSSSGDCNSLDGHAPKSENPRLRHGASFTYSLLLYLFPFPSPPIFENGQTLETWGTDGLSFFEFVGGQQCANTGYTPGFVHFSCRAPRRGTQDSSAPPVVDLIAFLRSLAPLCEQLAPGWTSRVGEDWARGHREATGGIVKAEEFRVLMEACQVGVKKDKDEKKINGGAAKKVIDPGQKTTLDGFFKISPAKKVKGEKV